MAAAVLQGRVGTAVDDNGDELFAVNNDIMKKCADIMKSATKTRVASRQLMELLIKAHIIAFDVTYDQVSGEIIHYR